MRMKVSMENRRRGVILIALAVALILGMMVILGGFRGTSRAMTSVRLRCVATQDVKPFGNQILYYDGITLFCLSANGGERWSYTLGENASYNCNDQVITAWSGSQLHIINRNGSSTYNENLADNIQFAKPGSKYVAVVLGNDASPSLIIKDLEGSTVDNLTTEYEDMVILDLDFFHGGDFLWTTAVDIYGTVPDVLLHTYQVNMTSSGEISLGQSLTYAILYSSATEKLNVISTHQLRQFDHRGTEDTSAAKLVYGWQLCDHKESAGNVSLLFALTNQNGIEGINQLRLIAGKQDKRFSLPSICVGAALYRSRVVAFAQDTVYIAESNAARFQARGMPIGMEDCAITGYLGMLTNNVALVSCGDAVYAVTLP